MYIQILSSSVHCRVCTFTVSESKVHVCGTARDIIIAEYHTFMWKGDGLTQVTSNFNFVVSVPYRRLPTMVTVTAIDKVGLN